jgi:uncharacterized protein
VAVVTGDEDHTQLCQSCGACCDTSREWPRFSTEDDEALAKIPIALVDPGLGRMACDGERCAALVGVVGTATRCSIYHIRPDVCRACLPGDDACTIARDARGMPAITAT